MNHLPQGDDLLRALKARARELQALSLRSGLKTKYGAALEAASRELGFRDWNTASAHGKRTRTVAPPAIGKPRKLTAELLSILDDAAADDPASEDTRLAFERGFVFALDVKDAEQLRDLREFVPADDGWHIAARNTWIELVHEADFETGRTLLESLDAAGLQEVAMDDLQNYRLFRFSGTTVPATLSEAYALVSKISFFAPTDMWLGGEFINLSEVPEIRVDGQVVYSTTQPGNDALQAPTPEAEKLWHLLNDEERQLFQSMPAAEQSFVLHEAKKRTPYGQGRFRQVAASVTSSWRDASKPK